MMERCRALEANLQKNKIELGERREIIDWALERKREKDMHQQRMLGGASASSGTDLEAAKQAAEFRSMTDRCRNIEECMHRNQAQLEDRRRVIDKAMQRKRADDAFAAAAGRVSSKDSNVSEARVG